MKSVATLPQEQVADRGDANDFIRMDEGLIGFSQYKRFKFFESPDITPFFLMESEEQPKVGFVVIDSASVVPGYASCVPEREWEAVGVTEKSKKLAFVIIAIGPTAKESTANLQAPILINYETMTARQVILTDPALSSRRPLAI